LSVAWGDDSSAGTKCGGTASLRAKSADPARRQPGPAWCRAIASNRPFQAEVCAWPSACPWDRPTRGAIRIGRTGPRSGISPRLACRLVPAIVGSSPRRWSARHAVLPSTTSSLPAMVMSARTDCKLGLVQISSGISLPRSTGSSNGRSRTALPQSNASLVRPVEPIDRRCDLPQVVVGLGRACPWSSSSGVLAPKPRQRLAYRRIPSRKKRRRSIGGFA